MMRYQRLSPDILPLSNGRKTALRTFKEDDSDHGGGGGGGGRIPTYTNLEPAKPLKGRSASESVNHSSNHDHLFKPVSFNSVSTAATPSENHPAPPLPPPAPVSATLARTTIQNQNHKNHHEANRPSHGSSDTCGGHVLLQWGQHKRSRRSRTESRPPAASKFGGIGCGGHESSPSQSRHPARIQRRSAIAAAEKLAAVAAAAAAAGAMPPPCGSYTRGANLRPCTPLRDATGPLFNNSRIVDERSSGPPRLEKRSPPLPPDKAQKTSIHATPNGSGITAKADCSIAALPDSKQPPGGDQEICGGGSVVMAAGSNGEKLNLDRFEWPRIYISLSRKEKEDDFLIMKGTKLPQRPKKRAKNIDKTLQYCFPGMWLSDLTRSRYEVREKKCVKKRRRGLKGMESMDSDSE